MSISIHSKQPQRTLATPMLFAALEGRVQERLRVANPARRFASGQFIQHRGDVADGFWLIEEGTVRVGVHLPGGEFRAVAVLGPGDSYGELAVFAGRRKVVDAIARGQCLLRFIPARPFLEAVEASPASSRALLAALSAHLQDTLNLLAGWQRGSNVARLAELLANLTSENEWVAFTQQELAELLGVTRATANNALAQLAEEGLVERGYGRIRVKDREALALYSLG